MDFIIEEKNRKIEEQGNTIKTQGNTIKTQGNTIKTQGNTIKTQGNTIMELIAKDSEKSNTIMMLQANFSTLQTQFAELQKKIEINGATRRQ